MFHSNSLLGKPDQYTSKVNFADTRCEQYSADDPTGGSIEVFENNEDAKARYDYVEPFNSLSKQYLYLHDNVFLRIAYEVDDTAAAEYVTKLVEIIGADLDATPTEEANYQILYEELKVQYDELEAKYNALLERQN